MIILLVTSTAILGVFLGAQICEGVLFVPYWKSLAPKDFFDLHQVFGKKIYQFFAPLTILATVIPLITTAYSFYSHSESFPTTLGMAVFTLLFFSTYFMYFKEANRKFATQSLTFEELPNELNRWGNWHWVRIILESIAFIFALVTLTQI